LRQLGIASRCRQRKGRYKVFIQRSLLAPDAHKNPKTPDAQRLSSNSRWPNSRLLYKGRCVARTPERRNPQSIMQFPVDAQEIRADAPAMLGSTI
jgi:hypothetical protein